MLQALQLSDVLAHRALPRRALCAIVFAPPFSEIASKGVLPRLGYLHHRSGETIHFYCVGFGAYGRDGVTKPRDAVRVGSVRLPDDRQDQNHWWFSESKFASFVQAMHDTTSWRYSGETELLLFGPSLNPRDCLCLKLLQMIADGALLTPAKLFEDLVNYSQRLYVSTAGFSDAKMPDLLCKATVGALTEGPKGLLKAFKEGAHYMTVSIERPA